MKSAPIRPVLRLLIPILLTALLSGCVAAVIGGTAAGVKTALLDIVDLPGFDPTRVNVTTVHRTVYLMGLVTREEAERVADIARNVAGVEKVVRVFEFQD